jgi:hypothetical protein
MTQLPTQLGPVVGGLCKHPMTVILKEEDGQVGEKQGNWMRHCLQCDLSWWEPKGTPAP